MRAVHSTNARCCPILARLMRPGPMLARVMVAWLLAVVAAGCGSGGSGGSTTTAPTRAATLMLDFTPNAVHAGIYSAIGRHYAQNLGLRLRVIAPTASSDPIKLLETGRIDFA